VPVVVAATAQTPTPQTTEAVLIVRDTGTPFARRTLADAIVGIYEEGYRPPTWAVDCYVDKFDAYAKEARLFIDKNADRNEAVRLAKVREPVNITLVKHYNASELEKSVGYQESGYQTYFNTHKILAPNIGVLTKSKVRMERPVTRSNKSPYAEKDVWIYHAVGAALDSDQQPDYIFYVKDKDETNVRDGLLAFYKSVFAKIFAAAAKIGAAGIVMSLVGADAFAKLYPGGPAAMHDVVWIPAFEAVRALDANKGTVIRVIGKKLSSSPAGKHMLSTCGTAGNGDYPSFLFGTADFSNWMVVNAWDCHSLPGNGNSLDRSLDGFVGRSSAVHFFGWGIANPFLVQDANVHGVETA
jgi:hypothetical protein